MTNTLYYGDNLEILREHVPDESVDLVYLDPPFNSNASYNVLFREQTGEASPAQIKAFTDTWQWTLESQSTFENEIMLNPSTPEDVKNMVDAFLRFIGHNAMMAYLVMMAPRLVELRRVLKPTGSIYLHCDPTASHYLKLLMDAVFGKENFRSEVTWRRTTSHNNAVRNYGALGDAILFYSKADGFLFNVQHTSYSQFHLDNIYKYTDENGRIYGTDNLRNPSPRPNLTYDYKGYKPHPNGWTVSLERMKQLDAEGRLHFPKSKQGRIRRKVYLDEMPGVPVGNIWDDIRPISSQSRERLGYPTQKPLALLERIIQASSNEGDIVLDPFCGCGTAIAAAHKLNRNWIGIDITHLAVALMKNRLKTAFNILPGQDYAVVGEPVDAGSARALAEQDRFQFEFWAMSLLEAFPREQKKGADRGIDGVVYFIDGPRRAVNKAIVQVKSGRVSSPLIRDLVGTVEREKAAMGLFITLEEPTRDMRTEAVSAGFYHSDLWQTDYPKIQIRTVGELLEGRAFEIPRHPQTYQAAQRITRPAGEQGRLG